MAPFSVHARNPLPMHSPHGTLLVAPMPAVRVRNRTIRVVALRRHVGQVCFEQLLLGGAEKHISKGMRWEYIQQTKNGSMAMCFLHHYSAQTTDANILSPSCRTRYFCLGEIQITCPDSGQILECAPGKYGA